MRCVIDSRQIHTAAEEEDSVGMQNKPLVLRRWWCAHALLGAAACFASPGAFAQYAPNVEILVKPGPQRSLGGVDALIPLRQNGTSLLAADVKGHLEEAGAHELNLGATWRSINASGQWAF